MNTGDWEVVLGKRRDVKEEGDEPMEEGVARALELPPTLLMLLLTLLFFGSSCNGRRTGEGVTMD